MWPTPIRAAVRQLALFAWRALASCRGFSSIEAASVVTAVALLGGLTAPTVTNYLESAKLVRAHHDVATVAVSVIRLANDVGARPVARQGWPGFELLVGAGATPRVMGGGTAPWASEVDGRRVGLLDDHLVTNAAGYVLARSPDRPGWRGAYVQSAIGMDPWGHRYAVNVGVMRRHGADVLTLSAGADGTVSARFDGDGLPSAGDDIVALISSGAGR